MALIVEKGESGGAQSESLEPGEAAARSARPAPAILFIWRLTGCGKSENCPFPLSYPPAGPCSIASRAG